MQFLLYLFGILLAFGLFQFMSDRLHLPSRATLRAMASANKRTKKVASTFEGLLMKWSVKAARHIHLEDYKRGRQENTLNAAGMNLTPEVFTAYCFLKAGVVMLAVIPCLLILPITAPITACLSLLIYYKERKKADEKLREKREQIESELPRFVATITQELKASRDVLGMVEHYKRNAGDAFAEELDILTADMRSSSYEAALTRFEARLNSPLLSDITRGLIGVLRGDDGAMYFQMLAHDMKQIELQRLKAQALKIPPKIRVLSFVMLMCFLLTYLAIIGYEIVTSLGMMF